jgi:hypothetical protein
MKVIDYKDNLNQFNFIIGPLKNCPDNYIAI